MFLSFGECPCRSPKLSLDYYSLLGLDRKKLCREDDINDGFKKYALRLTSLGKHFEVWELFRVVAEAYVVLSDPSLRAIYDQYGERGLKEGIFAPDGEPIIAPFVYHGDPEETFRQFLEQERKKNSANSKDCSCLIREKDDPIIESLSLTLTEIFFGCEKEIPLRIHSIVFGKKEGWQTKTFNIKILPGTPTGTRITFSEAGNQVHTQKSGDVIFVVEDSRHKFFKRDGSNLQMNCRVTLEEALIGTVVEVQTVDERYFRVPITSIISPGYKKIVRNEGLPLIEDPEERGNLVINFEVEFPAYIPVKLKDYIIKAFGTPSKIGCVDRKVWINKLNKHHNEKNPPTKEKAIEICNFDMK